VTGKKLANPDTDGNSLYHRAVSCKAKLRQVLIISGLSTYKQEFCSPSLQPSRLQNTCFFARPDSAIWTNLIYNDKFDLCTRTY